MKLNNIKNNFFIVSGLLAISGSAYAQAGLFGGEEIEGGDTRCSAGFNLRQTNSNLDDRFMVSAGHCFNIGDTMVEKNRGRSYPSQTIGTVDYSTEGTGFSNGIAYDLSLTYLDDNADPKGEVIWDTDYNFYTDDIENFPLGDEGTRLAITEILHTDDIEVGMEVCKTGSSTGTQCGEILQLFGNGIWASTMCVEGGDSGGAVFAPDRDRYGNLIGTAKALGVARGHSNVSGLPSAPRLACENQGFSGNTTFVPLTSLEEATGNTYDVITNKVTMTKRNATNFSIDGNWAADNGQDIYLWSANQNNINQQWIEIDRGDGYYSYQKFGTTHCIDGDNGGDLDQNVYLWDCYADNHNQHWLKVDVGGGAFKLVKRNAPGFAIDGGNGAELSQSIELWNSSSTSQNLHWIITPIEQ